MNEKNYEHRSYYAKDRKFEPKDIIREFGLNFNVGCVVKYIARCGNKKGERNIDDISKSIVYLEYEIEALDKYDRDWGLVNKNTDMERIKDILKDWKIDENSLFGIALRSIFLSASKNNKDNKDITKTLLIVACDSLKVYLNNLLNMDEKL